MAFTDYHTACGDLPKTFNEMLAACIREYNDHFYLNTVYTTAMCDTITSFWDCDMNIDPERALVENCFALDECGNLALKIFFNTGEAPE